MKNLLIFLFAALLISSCGNAIVGEGPVISEERTFETFTGISSGISADIIIRQGGTQNVRLEGQKNLLEIISTTVKNGVLVIDTKPDVYFTSNSDVKIYITLPQYKLVSLQGSGDLIAETDLSSDAIEINATGSGDVELKQINASKIGVSLTGSGDLEASGGRTEHLDVSATGSGNVDLSDLEANTAEVSLTGSGDAAVRVKNKLKASLSGSGDLEYFGNAEVNSSVSGSGTVRKR